MKLFLTLVGVAVAFALGYRLEPNFRANLTGKASDLETLTTAPAVAETPKPVTITPPPPPTEELIPAPAPAPVVEPVPAVEPTPAPKDELATADAEPEPATDDQALDETMVADEADTTPDEAEDVQANAESASETAAIKDVVALMKEAIAAGALKDHIKPEQILGWKDAGEETIDGQTYQTGLVAYRAKTIFGENSTIEAKALIREGKIERWIWPKSGMEIE